MHLGALSSVFVAAASASSSSIPRLPVPAEPFVSLEHVNINAGEHWHADTARFWFQVMGAADDPRGAIVASQVQAAGGSMKELHWANFGLQQFHMPVGEPENPVQVVRGEIGLAFVAEQLDALRARLVAAAEAHTVDADGSIQLQCPMGNRLRAVQWNGSATWFGPSAQLDPGIERALPGGASSGLGIQYVRFDVPAGTAGGICRFYVEVFGAMAVVEHGGAHSVCRLHIGHHQSLMFAEQLRDEESIPAYDGHHVAVYINDFEGVYERSRRAGLVWNNPRFPHLTYDTLNDALRHNEFRVKTIVDPESGEALYTLEHEVRSLMHPGFSCRHWISAEGGARETAMVGDYPLAHEGRERHEL